MTWVVATEMAKILNVGGYIFIEMHCSFSSHERPWHFLQFSDVALKLLFSGEFGFKCIEAGMSNSIVGRFSSPAYVYLRRKPVGGFYCTARSSARQLKTHKDSIGTK